MASNRCEALPPGAGMGRGECLSVIDCAMEEGDMGECTRVLVRGAWRGSDGDVEGEVDPSEPPGTALDSWRDAAAAAALALALVGRCRLTLSNPC